jgi:hypothetical protein
MSNVVGQKRHLLNRLERELPEGLLADGHWFDRHGFSRQLRSHYLAAGWLEQPARGVYRRPRGKLSWQQAVISLQTILEYSPLIVGGRTALELQGYAHYLAQKRTEVHLYGPKPPPGWLSKLQLHTHFVYHNSRRLLRNDPITRASPKSSPDKTDNRAPAAFGELVTTQAWGQWDWPLTLSTPERALFELLDELPRRESFHQVDQLFAGLSNLGPRRLKKLLVDIKSVKAKRLFFFFAERHQHAWLKRLDKDAADLGKGKRVLVPGGKLDPDNQITVPRDLDGI